MARINDDISASDWFRWDGYPVSTFSEAWSPPGTTDPVLRKAADLGYVDRFSDRGLRIHVQHAGGSGTVDRVWVRDGIQLSVINCTIPERDSRTYDADESIVFLYASLTGDVRFRVRDAEPIIMDRPELTLVRVPRGMKLNIDIRGGVRQQRLFAIFRQGAIGTLLGVSAEKLPEVLQGQADAAGEFGRLVSIPLDHRVASLVADTIDTQLTGELRALQYEGRLLELVAFALEGFEVIDERLRPAVGLVKNERDADLARRAIERLSKEYNAAPDLDAMAGELGTNSSKLRSVFKSAFGMTMSEYCLDRRMREAQKLLLEARLSIAQVAERVGYEYHSGFSAAFTRHVGVTPKEYREQRAPINVTLRGDADPAMD